LNYVPNYMHGARYNILFHRCLPLFDVNKVFSV